MNILHKFFEMVVGLGFNPFSIVHWTVLGLILLLINYHFKLLSTETIITVICFVLLLGAANYYYNPSIDSHHIIQKGYCKNGVCFN